MTREKRENVVILGGGSWGTALARLLATNGHNVALWVFEPELADQMRATRVNRVFLPQTVLPDSLLVTNDMNEALAGREAIISMGPSAFARPVCSQAAPLISGDVVVLNAAKGLEPQTLKRMSQVLEEVFPNVGAAGIATLSGPTFAKEVAKMRPTAAVIASKSLETARRFQRMLSCSYFRLYTNSDVVGVEFGGALKNIVAIASGIVEGLGLGPNTQAALITRGLSEMTRLGAANGAKPATFQGLSGIGDLVLTCTSRLSRNFSVGLELARGKRLKQILDGMSMVAEGVGTSKSALQLSNMCNVEMPITEQMCEVMFEDKPPDEAVRELMARPLRDEMSW